MSGAVDVHVQWKFFIQVTWIVSARTSRVAHARDVKPSLPQHVHSIGKFNTNLQSTHSNTGWCWVERPCHNRPLHMIYQINLIHTSTRYWNEPYKCPPVLAVRDVHTRSVRWNETSINNFTTQPWYLPRGACSCKGTTHCGNVNT